MIAFDSDVLIYAASVGNPLGSRVADVLERGTRSDRVGSVLLLPEMLSKPMREPQDFSEVESLTAVLGKLDLRPLDEPTARLATTLAAKYRLRAADAAHLATAVAAGADAFLTNNRRDFTSAITEIDIVYPEDLRPASA